MRLFRRRLHAPLFGAVFVDGRERRVVGSVEEGGQGRWRRLREGSLYRFSFVCPRPGLASFGLALGEPAPDTRVEVTLDCKNGDGSRETLVPARVVVADPASDWSWFDFDTRPSSRGAVVRVEVRVVAGACSTWEARVPRASSRTLDGAWRPVDTAHPFDRERWLVPTAAPAVHVSRDRPLRILTHRWHVAHQYEIYKLPHRFVLGYGLPGGESRLCTRWSYEERPKPANATFVPWDEVRLDEIDLVLLHFDENVIDWQNAAAVLSSDWGATFGFLSELEGKPKLAVCHGTPQFRGMCDASYEGPLFEELAGAKQRLLRALGDIPVVCNSHQAQQQWGFPDSRVIWHGFAPEEFPLGARSRGVLGQGRALDARPHYRGKKVHDEVSRRLPPAARPAVLDVPRPQGFPGAHGNAYASAKFRAYVRALGEYSVYFNSTLNSPMPRSRGEAMMCGLATVSVQNHDVDRFVDNEVNGFYSDDVGQLVDYVAYLHAHPERAREIGERGRERAIERFHVSRFLDDWERLLREVTA